MARTAFVACSLMGLLAGQVSAVLEGGEVAVESPFGVVCPWPGVQQAGVQWCRVGAGATAFVNWPEIEFAANSFVERQYLHSAEKSGCSDSIRFGSEFGYRFDLRNMRSAQLRINVGANGANQWNLLVSKDGNDYVIERSGKSWPSWQTVALDKYLAGAGEAAGTIYVKIQGTDCQVREVVLEAGAGDGLRPAEWKTYQKSPSELIVYDARPELGIKMHGIDDFGFGIVRRDGRTPRPTYQWLLQEQVNSAIQEKPTYEVDISCRPAKDRVPVGYDCFWQGEVLVIRRVKIDSVYPTRIELKEEDATDR